ncbi:LytTR family DNA-binding domain-containing protein [Chryseobacterium paludis]|uniref:LytTR family DNA-binding domain-containing protein n=1 Tax=Chryseobacterium paludis TaxID=2956784 RepID=UPI0021C02645|nr:LytTR family DNA-binding domain-containing protein [Chryseobacterium paludis]
MIQIFSFTSYPYPKSESQKEVLVSSLSAGILIYLFLIIFQPFDTDQFHHEHKYLLLFPYSIIFGIFFYIINLLVLKINNWNVGNELIKISSILLLASIPSYFYNSLIISHVQLDFVNYLYMLMYTFAIGIPISIIYVLSRYIYLKKDHENTAMRISAQLQETPIIDDDLSKKTLEISTGTSKLEILEDDFIYAQSLENYCAVYYNENHTVKKVLLRISSSKLLNQVETHTIKRCHRSYIINLNKVKNIKGNAQGYKLSIEKIDLAIPVSRSYAPYVISLLQSLNV